LFLSDKKFSTFHEREPEVCFGAHWNLNRNCHSEETMTTTINNTEESTSYEYTGQMDLPLPQEISGEVLIEKYAKGSERDVRDVRARVARALASIEVEDKRALWEARFLEAQENGFVPAGRINSAAGTDLCATRFDLRNRRRPPRHLHRAAAGRRDHAPRRWRRL
jgi:hypothetical protein